MSQKWKTGVLTVTAVALATAPLILVDTDGRQADAAFPLLTTVSSTSADSSELGQNMITGEAFEIPPPEVVRYVDIVGGIQKST